MPRKPTSKTRKIDRAKSQISIQNILRALLTTGGVGTRTGKSRGSSERTEEQVQQAQEQKSLGEPIKIQKTPFETGSAKAIAKAADQAAQDSIGEIGLEATNQKFAEMFSPKTQTPSDTPDDVVKSIISLADQSRANDPEADTLKAIVSSLQQPDSEGNFGVFAQNAANGFLDNVAQGSAEDVPGDTFPESDELSQSLAGNKKTFNNPLEFLFQQSGASINPETGKVEFQRGGLFNFGNREDSLAELKSIRDIEGGVGDREKLQIQHDNKLEQIRETARVKGNDLSDDQALAEVSKQSFDALLDLRSNIGARGPILGPLGALGGAVGLGTEKRAEFESSANSFVFNVGALLGQAGRAFTEKEQELVRKKVIQASLSAKDSDFVGRMKAVGSLINRKAGKQIIDISNIKDRLKGRGKTKVETRSLEVGGTANSGRFKIKRTK